MSALSLPLHQQNANPAMPVIDPQLQGPSDSSREMCTAESALLKPRGDISSETKTNDELLANVLTVAGEGEKDSVAKAGEGEKDSMALKAPSDVLSCDSSTLDTKGKLGDGSASKKTQQAVTTTLVEAPSNVRLGSDPLTKPAGAPQGQGLKAVPTDINTAIRTPVSKRRFQEIPSSADSSHDDMTLAEMKVLVSQFGPHRRVPRSLAQVLNEAAHDAENIHPQVSDGAVTVASGIVSTTLNRCLPVSPTPSQRSGSVEEADKITLPPFAQLVNFPQYCGGGGAIHNKKFCVMCGQSRVVYKKRKESDGNTPFILSGNKGICSCCEMAAWTLTEGNIPIKFCQQCYHFRPLALFASKVSHRDQSLVGSCVHCRDRKKERAKKRKQEKARRLQEKSGVANASDGVASTDMAAKDASECGKRKTVEEDDTSDETSSKRVKLVLPVEVDADAEMKVATAETPSLSSSSSSASLGADTDSSSKDSVPSKSPPVPVQPKVTNFSNGAQVVDTGIDGKEIHTPKAIPSVDRSSTATAASKEGTPSTRNRCIPLASCNVSDSGPKPSNFIIPAFPRLVNFSQHSPLKNGRKMCVMCGDSRLVQKRTENDGTTPFIPFGNKGVCSECEITAWRVMKTKAEIKWCQAGVHFRPLAELTEGSSCSACRELASSYK